MKKEENGTLAQTSSATETRKNVGILLSLVNKNTAGIVLPDAHFIKLFAVKPDVCFANTPRRVLTARNVCHVSVPIQE